MQCNAEPAVFRASGLMWHATQAMQSDAAHTSSLLQPHQMQHAQQCNSLESGMMLVKIPCYLHDLWLPRASLTSTQFTLVLKPNCFTYGDIVHVGREINWSVVNA